MGFKVTYSKMSSFQFQKVLQKLETAATDGFTAYRIRKIATKLKSYREQIANEYKKQIMDKYAKRDEKGEYKEEDFVPMEDKVNEYNKALEDFGKNEVFVDRHPLTIADIKDIKITAEEMEAMGEMFDDSDMETKEARQLMSIK